ncbi:MAG: response regulator transcription factor [Dehalococcoidia bacterium]|nr:response regulator transcription factor [Dehalococcoidia bacterium]
MADSKIMVIEDDTSLRSALSYTLDKEGYEVITARDGNEALNLFRSCLPDLILLDIMLPIMNGLEVCRIIRKESGVPIIMLTARAEETDKIAGLDIGADDYVTKPFSMRELMARVRALLRREHAGSHAGGIFSFGEIIIDTARHNATRGGQPLELSPREFDLLAFLAQNKGLVFSRDQLIEKVWGYDFTGSTRTVDVHIRWLRGKIETDPESPRHLLTIRGTGYKLEK